MIALIASLIAALAGLGAEATVVFGDDMIRIRGGSGSIRLIFRNASPREWNQVRLEVSPSAPLAVKVVPERIPRCQPGDRCAFQIHVRTQANTPERRFPATVKLVAKDQPGLLTTSMLVDASPKALQRERGWMDAGSIQIGSRSQTSRVLVLTLVSALPVALLLVLGLALKRRARRRLSDPE